MAAGKYEKSYFDVLGICCLSEVPLVEKLLYPLDGMQEVTVLVKSRTVIVVHDTAAISTSQIEKVLNQARLDASVRAYGGGGEWWRRPVAESVRRRLRRAFDAVTVPAFFAPV